MAEFDIRRVLTCLAKQRPIFHSEADFQFALAWQIEKMTPDAGVRLEMPFSLAGSNRYLDIWLRAPGIAIELKYRTRRLSFLHEDESFSLKNQSARDHGRYDFIEDIRRIEEIATKRRVADGDPFSQGYAVLLTNDNLYWENGGEGTVDEAFRIHEGLQLKLKRRMAWAPWASEGTINGREKPLVLRNSYTLRWRPYSNPPTENGEFRYLAVQIA